MATKTVRIKRKRAPELSGDNVRGRAALANASKRAADRDRKRATVFAAPRTIFLPNELTDNPEPSKPTFTGKAPRPRKLQDDFDRAQYRRRLALGVGEARKMARQPDQILDAVPKPTRKKRVTFKRSTSKLGKMPTLEGGKFGSLRDIPSPDFGDSFVSSVGDKLGDVAKSAARDLIGAAYTGQRRGAVAGAAEIADRPVELGKQGAELFGDVALGDNLTKAIQGRSFDLKYAVAEAAVLPLGPKGTTLITRALRAAWAAKEGAKAIKAGEGVRAALEVAARESSQPIRPASKLTKLLRGGKGERRAFELNGSEATVAAARSRTGRALEKAFDKARPFTSKIGVGKTRLVKDETQKWAQATAQRLKFDQKVEMFPAARLRQIGSKLNTEHQYALRAMAMGVDPEEAKALHLARAGETEDALERSAHLIHAANYSNAGKYILRQGDELELAPGAPAALKKAWQLLPETSEAREGILSDLGLLTDEQMAERVHAPGRIYKGAKWTPEETYAQSVVEQSPARAKLRSEMLRQLPEEQVDNILAVHDAHARAYWQKLTEGARKRIGELEKDARLYSEEGRLPEAQSFTDEANVLRQMVENAPYDAYYARLGGASAGVTDDAARTLLEQRGRTIPDGLREGELGASVEGSLREQGVHGWTYRGLLPVPRPEVVVTGLTDRPLEAWQHELDHFKNHIVGSLPGRHQKVLSEFLGDDPSLADQKFEELTDHWFTYLLEGKSKNRKLNPVFAEIEKGLREEGHLRGGFTDRAGLPEQIRDVFDSLTWYDELKGGALRGAEDFKGGKAYVPFEKGFPTSLRHPLVSTRSYVRSMLGLFGPRKGSAIGGGFVDPSTKKAFKGLLIEHGWHKGEVTNASADSLAKAVRMSSAAKAREALLEIATEAPSRADDIPIKVNPSLDAPKALKRYWETFEEMRSDMAVSRFALKELEKVDGNLFENLSRAVSPNEIDGLSVEQVARDILDGVREPVDNIRWVPAKALYEGDLFANPKAFFGRTSSWGQLESVGVGVDVVNDFMKMSLLQLNPAYIGMNLLGNTALVLMQQGPFALLNLPRAAFLSRELSPDLAAAVDHLMGRGIAQLMDTRAMLQHPSRFFADVTGMLVDLIPRRSAFLHEAWALGYRSSDDIAHLLTSDALRDDLYHITEKANDAIIDYERLSPVERKIIARGVFIYPWIKGATRFTYRFPAEHPLQAMAMAYLYERQQQAADEQLGERPWYADLLIPLGQTERYGQSYPLTLNPKQLIPFSTPVDFASALAGAITGNPDTQPFIDVLQPFYPALAASLTGYDSFSQREVPRGLGTLLREMVDIPIVDRFKALGQSPQERADAASNRLYPRDETDEILKTVLGSLAPTPYNPEKGEFYAEGNRGKTPEQKAREKLEQIAGLYDPSAEPAVKLALDTKVQYEHAKAEARKKLGTDDLDDVQLTEVLLDVAVEHVPDLDRAYIISKLNPSNAGAIRGALESELGWGIIDALTAVANQKLKAEETRADGAVVSGS